MSRRSGSPSCARSSRTRRASRRKRSRTCASSARSSATSRSSSRARRPHEALAPDEGDGAAGFTAVAERAVAPLEQLAPELARAGDELRDVELRLRETATELRGFLETLGAEPGRLEEIEGELERISDAKRRFRCETYEELLARAAEARSELDALDAGLDPAQAAAEALAAAEERMGKVSGDLHKAREPAPRQFADAVAAELHDIGMGEGEFQTLVTAREPGPTGADDVQFLIRPNPGMPLAPVAETASGGELSRIALAIAAVAGGDTLVFDEIDAGSAARPRTPSAAHSRAPPSARR